MRFKLVGVLAGAVALALSAGQALAAPKFSVLYDFCTDGSCSDGASPEAGLIADADGNLYGTAEGGVRGQGVVYELVLRGTRYAYKKIYDFCAVGDCPDGSQPYRGNLILDTKGVLYGTTFLGGAHSGGTVFKLVPNKRHTKWQLKTLYDFCSIAQCADGGSPIGGLSYQGQSSGALYDGRSPLFGTAYKGGAASAKGVVFKLTVGAHKANERVLYAFCPTGQCDDGSGVNAGIAMTPDGHLFGTTTTGGTKDQGVLFELVPGAKRYTFGVRHSFCQDACADGANPTGTLTVDADGNLYGATLLGGASNWGVIFKFAPAISEFTTLYTFCTMADCVDGKAPNGGLAIDGQGDLYGTANAGGTADYGTAFKLHGSALTVLHTFCTQGGCTDGRLPLGSTLLDAAGNLYSTTSRGLGSSGNIFKIAP